MPNTYTWTFLGLYGNGGTGATTLTGYVYGNGASAVTASATIPSTAISGPDTLYDEINSLLTSAGGVSYLAWEYATEVTRNGQLVNALANQLGWTQTQLDDLFVTASNIFS